MNLRDGIADKAFDVVVVGLGPVGAVLGNLLGMAGLRVAIFEREPDILNIPRAVGFDDEVMRVFQTIGLADAMLPVLRVGTGAQYIDQSGEVVLRRVVQDVEGPQGWRPRYNFHQPDIEKVLRKGLSRFQNVEIFLRHDVFAVDEESDGLEIRVEETSTGKLKTINASFIVGCDGARSLVRRLIGTEMDDLGLHEPWIVADFVLKKDLGLPKISTQFCHPKKAVTFVNVVGDRRRMEFQLGADAETKSAPSLERVWALAKPWLTPAVAELERWALYTFHSLIAKSWRRERLLIAGDSAHQTPPFLGQGLCTGIRDATAVAWRLVSILRRAAPISVLESYGPERYPHAMAFVDGAVKIGAIHNAANPAELRRLAAEIGAEQGQLKYPTPKLGPGIYAPTTLGGVLSEQPRQADGCRLDDVLGYEFAIIGEQSSLNAMGARERELIHKLGLNVVVANGDTSVWLKKIASPLVLLRPDRYIFANVGDIETELLPALTLLANKICDATHATTMLVPSE